MSEPGPERRSGQRSPIELCVEYRRLNTFFADYTRNISQGGTFIVTDKPLSPGTELSFALRLPSLAEPLKLQGRVKWVVRSEEATSASPAGMGIEFLYVDDAEREVTRKLVEGLMVDELGEALSTRLLGRRPGT